jgi:hypothetical protein
MAQYEEALRLLEDHLDQSDFEPQPSERVERAEETLGVRFPPTYRRFLLEPLAQAESVPRRSTACSLTISIYLVHLQRLATRCSFVGRGGSRTTWS